MEEKEKFILEMKYWAVKHTGNQSAGEDIGEILSGYLLKKEACNPHKESLLELADRKGASIRMSGPQWNCTTKWVITVMLPAEVDKILEGKSAKDVEELAMFFLSKRPNFIIGKINERI